MMGKTRIEELCYELYGSWKQHDSWQRYAMVRELRELMKRPKASGSDHFERSGEDRRFGGDDRRFGGGQFREGADDDDETDLLWKKENPEDPSLNDKQLVETEVATEPIETEHGIVKPEANANVILANLEEEPIPQIQVPISKLERGLKIHNVSPAVCEDSQYVVGCDELCEHQGSILQVSHVKEGDVMGNCQYAMGKTHQIWSDSNFGCVNDDACQVFDVIPMRTKVLPKEHKKRFHKSWRFKFKDKVQPSKLIQEQLGVHEGNATRNQLRSPSGFVVEDFQETQWLFNDELKDNQIFQILIEEGSNSSAYQKFNGMRIGSHRLHHQKKLSKSPKSWKFKFKISLEDTDFVFKMDRWRRAPYVKLGTESFLEIESMPEDVQLVLLAFLHVNATEPRHSIGERDEMLEVARDVSKRSRLGLTFGIRESNGGEDQRAVCEQIIKMNVWLYQISLVHYRQTVNGQDERVFVRKPATWAVQGIWEKETHDVDITDAYYVLQDGFEQVVNYTPFSVVNLERLKDPGDESFQIKHKWRFKLSPLILEWELYSLALITNYAQQLDISRLMILMSMGWFTNLRSQLLFTALTWSISCFLAKHIVFFSTNLEVKVSSKEGDLI